MAVSEFLKSKVMKSLTGTYDHARTHYPIFGKKSEKQSLVVKQILEYVSVVLVLELTTLLTRFLEPFSLGSRHDNCSLCERRVECQRDWFQWKVTGELLMCDIIEAFIHAEYKPSEENKKLIAKIQHLETHNDHQEDADFL